MRLTNRQKFDLKTVRYFIPDQSKHVDITDEDIKTYFAWSDTGKPLPIEKTPGLQALIGGKTFREWHLKDYKDAIMKGDMFTFEIVDEFPEDIGRFILKSIGFGDYDAIKAVL